SCAVGGTRLSACVGQSSAARRNKRPRSQPRALSATQREPGALERAFSAYAPDERWTLIFAAATSPGNRHRSVTLGSSFAAALRASAETASDEYQPLPSIQALSDLASTAYGIGPARDDSRDREMGV